MNLNWKNLFYLVVFLLILIVGVFSTGGAAFGVFLLVFIYLFNRDKSPAQHFGHEVEQNEAGVEWETIYQTRLDQAFVAALTSRLRSAEVPFIVENKNLFNSGLNLKFGLAVPLKVRVPADQKKTALEILHEFKPDSEA